MSVYLPWIEMAKVANVVPSMTYVSQGASVPTAVG